MTDKEHQSRSDPESEPVSFVADARLLSVLGEQLIGSERVGVLELIKNAYDAGATNCIVTVDGVPGIEPSTRVLSEYETLPGPIFEIRDDGCGMTRNDIVEGWLRPASARRARIKDQLARERKAAEGRGSLEEYETLVKRLKREHGGRLPLGEKGVGRLATHRLGRLLWLRTKSAREPLEYELRIDWSAFDDLSGETLVDLSAVPVALTRQAPTTDYGSKGTGTVICCYGGRDGFAWTRQAIVELGRAINSLKSPIRAPKSFSPRFVSPHVAETEVASPLERVGAPFEFTVLVDEKGLADIDFRFVPPSALSHSLMPVARQAQVDLRTKNVKYWTSGKGGPRSPECGAFLLHVRAWLRLREWLGPEYGPVTAYLDEFGGMGVYRDGLASLPAQQAARNDWLGLAQGQIKKSSNISYYHMVGEVELQQEHTLALRDRSSREGLIETRAYTDLVTLLRAAVADLQQGMQEARDLWDGATGRKRMTPGQAAAAATAAAKVARRVADKYDFKKDPLAIAVAFGDDAPRRLGDLAGELEALAGQLRLLEVERDGLLEAAGFGLSVGVAVHELAKLAAAITAEVARLKRGVSGDTTTRVLVDSIGHRAEALLAEVRRLAPLRVTRAESARPVSVRGAIASAAAAFEYTVTKEEIRIQLDRHDFTVLGRHGALSQVFANLFDNAIYWVATTPRERQIRVSVSQERRTVIVADSGPGVSARMLPNLFQPFYSEKEPPSGLGLYICRYYLGQFNGTIRLADENERLPLPGAQFVVDLAKAPDPEAVK